MKTAEQIDEQYRMKSAEEVMAQYEKELQRTMHKRALHLSMPIAPNSVMVSHPGATPWLTYHVNNLAEMLAIFDCFAVPGMVVPMVNATSTFCHICPMTEIESRYYRGLKVRTEGVCVALTVEHAINAPPDAEMKFYINHADFGLCQVNVLLKTARTVSLYVLKAPYSERRDARTHSLEERKFEPNRLLRGYSNDIVKWNYSGGGPIETGAKLTYLWVGFDEDDAPDFRNFREQWGYMVEEFKL